MFDIDRMTPLWDTSLTVDERIDWFIGAMSLDEKIAWFAGTSRGIERLGVPGFGVGGEAAHGIEARNDQNGLKVPSVTTSFPQPIGMSASFDEELIKAVGTAVGTEARGIYKKRGHGLCRWAPTVDIERDPRWGRTEESYGEDPVLTGAMAGAYVRGMRGDDPGYIRCAATLKHFYGNNTECGRAWVNSSIDPRNRWELYLEPFRRCIEAGAEAVMTAYNAINGVPGICNDEVQRILKDRYGVTHVVGDGGALALVAGSHHYVASDAEAVAAAIKAGVDSISDNGEMVEAAVREALDLGLITAVDLERAIRNKLRTGIKLGLYDRTDECPYNHIDESVIDCPEHQAVCLKMTEESVVLLRNDGILPLRPDVNPADVAVIGPWADAWYHDWYGGMPPFKTTLLDGVSHILGARPDSFDGFDRVVIHYGERFVGVSEENRIVVCDTPCRFILEDWGDGRYTMRREDNGRYVSLNGSRDEVDYNVRQAALVANRSEALDWFVIEIFHILYNEDGSAALTSRFEVPVGVMEDGTVYSGFDAKPASFRIEVVEDGIEKARALASSKRTVILAVGGHPTICAKEEVDREDLRLPPHQEKLAAAVLNVRPDTVTALFANYPYALGDLAARCQGIIMMATGSEYLGEAMAGALWGRINPAGRLTMTWYKDVADLPDIGDYDIIQGNRTYRYYPGEVLYPFGFGLSYTSFDYRNYAVRVVDDAVIRVSLDVCNTGRTAGDEVVEIYAVAPKSRAKKPLRGLIGFTRLHDIRPGESRSVSLDISIQELRYYDVVSGSCMVEEGDYEIYAGASATKPLASAVVHIPGAHTGVRDLSKRIAADSYDECDNIELWQGNLGYDACIVRDMSRTATLVYRDCKLGGSTRLLLRARSVQEGGIKVYLDGDTLIGSYLGSTLRYEGHTSGSIEPEARRLYEERGPRREPIYEDIAIDLSLPANLPDTVTIQIELSGDVRLCYMRA